jgi:restriction endonuclease S subunit
LDLKSKQVQEFKETEIGKIPADWELKKLEMLFHISAGGDLSKIIFSKTKSNEYKYPVYSNSLDNKGVYGFSKEYQYEPECVTITARGNVGRAEVRKEPFSAIVRLLVLKPKQKLSCYFISSFINTRLDFSHVGSAQNQLTAPMISERLVAFPPPDEQEKISKVLSDLDTKIENLQNQNHTLEQMAQAIFKSWFIDFDGVTEWDDSELGKIPKGWDVKRIDELFHISAGGDVSKISFSKTKSNEYKYPVYSNSLNDNGSYGFSKEYQFEPECVTITARGNVGRAECRNDFFSAVVRLLVLKPKYDFLCSYTTHFINSKLGFSHVGSAVNQLTAPAISDRVLLIPLSKLLENFNILSKTNFLKIRENQSQIDTLTKTRDALLPKLMSGEIRV